MSRKQYTTDPTVIRNLVNTLDSTQIMQLYDQLYHETLLPRNPDPFGTMIACDMVYSLMQERMDGTRLPPSYMLNHKHHKAHISLMNQLATYVGCQCGVCKKCLRS